MEISLENRVYVIYSCNSSFISKIFDVSGTKKIYYGGMSIKLPKWFELDVAGKIFSVKDDNVIDNLDFRFKDCFTTDLEKASDFQYEEVYDELEKIQFEYGYVFYVECLNREWLLF